MTYEFGSSGIQIKGKDSYHVVKVEEKDEWLLLRKRGTEYFQAAAFVSPDEARAFVHACDLTLDKLT
jgi:uroporphyrinogen-III synthase